MIVPSWQQTMIDLHEAQTPEQLWIVLLVPHGIRSSSVWEEPYLLFRRFHLEDPSDAATTALLLCTDYRWRKATHHLVHELAGSGLLDDDALDQLAEWFTAAHLGVWVPRHLFAEAPVVFASSPTDDATLAVELPPTGRTPPRSGRRRSVDLVRVPRSVWPPLRRWAATRHVRSELTSWRDLIEAATRLPSRDAAMIVAGVMDAVDTIAEVERAAAIEMGLTSGSGVVRLAALPAFAELEGHEAAQARAATDPSEKVRAWSAKSPASTRRLLGRPPDSGGGHEPANTGQAASDDRDRPTLF